MDWSLGELLQGLSGDEPRPGGKVLHDLNVGNARQITALLSSAFRGPDPPSPERPGTFSKSGVAQGAQASVAPIVQQLGTPAGAVQPPPLPPSESPQAPPQQPAARQPSWAQRVLDTLSQVEPGQQRATPGTGSTEGLLAQILQTLQRIEKNQPDTKKKGGPLRRAGENAKSKAKEWLSGGKPRPGKRADSRFSDLLSGETKPDDLRGTRTSKRGKPFARLLKANVGSVARLARRKATGFARRKTGQALSRLAKWSPRAGRVATTAVAGAARVAGGAAAGTAAATGALAAFATGLVTGVGIIVGVGLAFKALNERLHESQRYLTRFNGQIGVAYAQSDRREMLRARTTGRNIAESVVVRENAWQDAQDAWRPATDTLSKAANYIAAGGAKLIEAVGYMASFFLSTDSESSESVKGRKTRDVMTPWELWITTSAKVATDQAQLRKERKAPPQGAKPK